MALRYVMYVCFYLTSCFHTKGPIGQWMGMAFCSSPAPVEVATDWALALWPTTGSVGRLAGLAGALAGPSAG